LPASNNAIVVDPISVIASALADTARRHAAALLGRQEVQALLDHVKTTHPAAVKGIVPELAGLGLVQRVLQHLVREEVSIRDIVAILEAIGDEAEWTKDAATIGEAARRRLSPAICAALASSDGCIAAAALDAELEERLVAAIGAGDRGPVLLLDQQAAHSLAEHLRSIARDHVGRAVIVCRQALRLPLARFAELCDVRVTVLGLAEVAAGYRVDIRQSCALA
jgi:flagellar biosynthesis protein FlhA